jgi:hypothetical protein
MECAEEPGDFQRLFGAITLLLASAITLLLASVGRVGFTRRLDDDWPKLKTDVEKEDSLNHEPKPEEKDRRGSARYPHLKTTSRTSRRGLEAL